MKFAYEPCLIINTSSEYTFHFIKEYREKPDVTTKTAQELREFINSHSEYVICGITATGFYQMEIDIRKEE